jgi:hypothetical protein
VKGTSFKAPWGVPLVVMTAFCVVMCLVVGVGGAYWTHVKAAARVPPWIGWSFVFISLVTLLISAAFMVRGYRLSDGSLRIQRLGWETRLDLSRLSSATADPEALKGSMRLFGNGGFFCFAGWFRNQKLGVYRAFATDAKRAVVLRIANKTVVVTPDDPNRFVSEIQIPHET